MKTAFLSLAVAAVLASFPVFAETAGIAVGEPAPAPQKSVRDMTPAERQQYWNDLPEEQKQRIIERRQKAAAEAAHQKKWKNLSGKQPSTTNVVRPKAMTGQTGTQTGQKPWAADPSLSADQKAAIERGAAMWNGMTPEQKKAFVMQHQGQINSAVQNRQGTGAGVNGSTGYGQ